MKPFCFRCFCELHPEEEIPHRRYQKEHYIHGVLLERYPDIVHNKPLASGRRPDWLITFDTHNIIVECDENQHLVSAYLDDGNRTQDIFKDLGNRPAIFIRFNPDKTAERVGCFGFNNMNKLEVNVDEWTERLTNLINTIEESRQCPTMSIVEIKLYYDDRTLIDYPTSSSSSSSISTL